MTTMLTDRDRAVLRAVAAGRCVFGADGCSLTIDSVGCCDQFAGSRLAGAGLIANAGRAELTPAGQAVLATV